MYRDIYDPAREAQDVIGSAGNSSTGSRTNYAVYTEALLPLTDAIELSAAARYDSYDDNSGSEVSPLLALRWRPSALRLASSSDCTPSDSRLTPAEA